MWNCIASASILALLVGSASILIPLSLLHVHSRRQGVVIALAGFIGCAFASDARQSNEVPTAPLGRSFEGASLITASHQGLTSHSQGWKSNPSRPADQHKFLEACHKARVKYAPGGREDMVDESARSYREKLLCDAFPSTEVQNWIGRIVDVSTDPARRVTLAIALNSNTTISGETNGSLKLTNASITGVPGALLENSPFTKGQWVLFSGSFIKAKRDCFSEKSVTLSGSIQKPEFAFQFSEISLIP